MVVYDIWKCISLSDTTDLLAKEFTLDLKGSPHFRWKKVLDSEDSNPVAEPNSCRRQCNIDINITVVAGTEQKFLSLTHMHIYVYGAPHIKKLTLCHILS